ncbi:MAG: hypothetical protein HY049_11965 [Acidobacteria bacterium]|nr:hypothetical protein [Acidobacteriota bacterium]
MHSPTLRTISRATASAIAVLLLTAGASFAQVDLTAKQTSVTLPDGRTVPMWGLACDPNTSSTDPNTLPTCTAMTGSAQDPNTWQPPLIRAAAGSALTINLTNSLPGGVPTSLVIVGQLSSDLGHPIKVPSPSHAIQGPTWPVQGSATDPVFTPPSQPDRIQSFGSKEIASGATDAVTWPSLRAGTYLIESGTHPSIQGPMGLYGVLIVSDAGFPVSYDADVPLLLSEIDPSQNDEIADPVTGVVHLTGFSETSSRVLRDVVSAISVALDPNSGNPISGSGYCAGDLLVFSGGGADANAMGHVAAVDANGAITDLALDFAGRGYSAAPGVTVTPDPNNPCLTRVGSPLGAVIDAELTLSGILCSGGAAACYPPAVNYDPRYYMINGVAFDKTNPAASTFSAGAVPPAGTVLLRFVNAGLRMHVPSVVGMNMALVAEDGNRLPGKPRIQSEVFLAAGKTYDVVLSPTDPSYLYSAAAIPVFDRQLSLSTNNQRDGGMQGYISVDGGTAPGTIVPVIASATDDQYFLIPGKTIKITDPAKGVIANDSNVYGVHTMTGTCGISAEPCAVTGGTLTLRPDGTFTYVPSSPSTLSDHFYYQANGSGPVAKVSLDNCASVSGCMGGAPSAAGDAYTSDIASRLAIAPPGVLANDTDPQGHPLTAEMDPNFVVLGGSITLNADGSFVAVPNTIPVDPATSSVTFQYKARNSQNTSSAAATVTVTFNGASLLAVQVLDGPSTLSGRGHCSVSGTACKLISDCPALNACVVAPVPVTDYRWIIEEDRTFHVDANNQVSSGGYVPNLGTSFHSSYMPLVAQGCVGAVSCEVNQTILDPNSGDHVPAVCDIGNGGCRPGDPNAPQMAAVDPNQVHLDSNKRYYISILPGDGANATVNGAGGPVPVDPNDPNGPQRPFSIAKDCPSIFSDFAPGTGACGHGMGGAPISAGQTAVDVKVQQTPFPAAKLTAFVFEDDNPLNGEVDAGGGVDILAPNEPGLGGFNIVLLDQAGGLGDSTGQPTYDMFNMPLSNALAGTRDPATGLDACPISSTSPKLCKRGTNAGATCTADTDCTGGGVCLADGLVGMIVTCPKFESDGQTLSPLAGQVIVENLYPGLYEVVASPAADRLARGEEWLQTNTLDGTKPHEAFIRPQEPAYFQEFGPAGFHVSIGFANPKIINNRKERVCQHLATGETCSHTLTGQISSARISRTPDQRIYGSGTFDSLGFTQCYVSLGDPGGSDFAFVKCAADGSFTFTGLPPGKHKITVFDQWNDIIVDGLSTGVVLDQNTPSKDLGEIPIMQWRTNLATRTYFDTNGDGVSQTEEPGLPLVSTNLRYRDGSFMGFNNTDLDGYAGFNEIFPFFNWMILEADTARYKQTGVHVIYDAGGPADGTPGGGGSVLAANVANTTEEFHLPADLRVPGAVYCNDGDCAGETISDPNTTALPANSSTGRIDPPWVSTEAWQGFAGETQFIEFGKAPFADGENGGIKGHVVYASTRPFDDPQLLLQLSWEPLVPHVTINLYKRGMAKDGTETLTLIDTTSTTSWDDWAQGFRMDPNGMPLLSSDGKPIPNMNCPGQDPNSSFFFTLKDSTQWLNPGMFLPKNSQFKCYDGMAMLNQVQPAPYDGMYLFPSVVTRNGTTGLPNKTNCTGCTTNPVDGTPMLPAGKYVVEMITPPGYELVKEEDKNILLGDVYIAPVTQQFGGLGSIFIMPDQAEVDSEFNADNPLNHTVNEGITPRTEGDTGSIEKFWPCIGQLRVVPDYMSLFPQAAQAAPFAGASRHLCDRKEVTLEDQSTALAKFYVFTSTHVAAHITGIVTDDFASEFDPFSPNYGEKFAVPNLPVSFKDWTGNEVSRAYTDQWGDFDGLHYSTWEVNPPNPTGYGPQMVVACMNDSTLANGSVDPLYNPGYSQFCYEWSLMPGQTAYLDTPVVPVMAFAEGYNPPDCDYPSATPAVKEVNGFGAGPWVLAGPGGPVTGLTLTNQGAGYTARPTVSFDLTSGGSGAAAVTFMKVTAVTPNSNGSGYQSVPTVTIDPNGIAGGSGAAAAATMRVNTVSVPTGGGGGGYTSSPTVTFPDGTGGIFPVTMRVSSIILSNSGSGYIARPTATFTNTGTGGTGAAASTFLSLDKVTPSNKGSGYTSAPAVTVPAPPCTINGTTCVQATASAVFNLGSCLLGPTPGAGCNTSATCGVGGTCSLTGGNVSSVTVTNPGNGYTSRVTVTFAPAPAGNHCSNGPTPNAVCVGTGQSTCGAGGTCIANANAVATNTGTSFGSFWKVSRADVTSGGLLYTSRPTVAFTAAPVGGTTATATNVGTTSGVFLSVNLITVSNGGSGYTGTSGTFAGGNGSGAQAVATLNLASLALTSNGSGYTSRPSVVITPPGTRCVLGATPGAVCVTSATCGGGLCLNGTTATANTFMSVDSLSLTNGGSGYSSDPNVTIGSPGCTINGTTCVRATATASITVGNTLTITALGDQLVPNPAYSGPSATAAPYNQKFITRHYGFGSQCVAPIAGDPNCTTVSRVTIGGVAASIQTWSDTTITVGVPGSVPQCPIRQRGVTGAPERCGELVITAGNGKQTVDAVTVTIGGKPPTYVNGENADDSAIQSAIDAAVPGDLIIVKPGTYDEMVIMWKPVRLQGVGAASVMINARPIPAGKIDPWREKVLSLFGLGPDGRPDGRPIMVDRVPLEGIVNWDTTVNGNLAELLQEPTIMGAYEGAGITVLAKGVDYHGADAFEPGTEAVFPLGTTRLTDSTQDCNNYPANFLCNPSRIDGLTLTNSSQGGGGIFAHGWTHNLEVSNNRVFGNAGTSSGGVSIGQGEFGDPSISPQDPAVSVPPLDATILATACGTGGGNNGGDGPRCPAGTQLPYWLQANVDVHHNAITRNASYGDSLYSTTPAAAGGVTFTTGSDYYRFDNNFVCGNLSAGDGGGVAHLGFIYSDPNGSGGITHNVILFNQSNNPTIATHGGGLLIAGAGPDGQALQCANALGVGSGEVCAAAGDLCPTYSCNGSTNDGAACSPTGPASQCPGGTCDQETCQRLECGTNTDVDCPPGLTEGAGPNLLVDGNLIQGNTAESGSGGGIRLQLVNGTEVGAFPTTPANWYQVKLQNNIIVDNVAGWDGGGVSLQDAVRVSFINNSVVNNDTTASAGVLFNSFGAPTSSVPPTCPGCTEEHDQPAGLVTMTNTPNLSGSLPTASGSLICPNDGLAANPYGVCSGGSNPGGHCATNAQCSGSGGTCVLNTLCAEVSLPVLANNVFWHNRAFHIKVTDPDPNNGVLGQQSSVALDPALSQASTGQCATAPGTPRYWDIGVRGDDTPTTHESGFTLAPVRTILTDLTGYSTGSDLAADPNVAREYCNGSRVPPECGAGNGCYGTTGYIVPPGVAQENIPNPVFSLTPAATVDEANNWINMAYGPLTLLGPSGSLLGRYVPATTDPNTTPTIGVVESSATINNTYTVAPTLDFFGTNRKSNSRVDLGAVEAPVPSSGPTAISANSLNFGHVPVDTVSPVQDLTLTNAGSTDLAVSIPGIATAVGFVQVPPTSGNDCGSSPVFALPAGTSCTLGIRFAPTQAAATAAQGLMTAAGSTPSDGEEIPFESEVTVVTDSADDVPQTVSLTGRTSAVSRVCARPGALDGTPCNDGDACTQSDSCQAGVCVGGDPVVCAAADQCHELGVCDTGTGQCSNPAKTVGSSCDTGDPSTWGVCSSGFCLDASVSTPAEMRSSLTLTHNGAGTRIAWSDAPGQFNVYRGWIVDGQPFSYNHACLNPVGPTSTQNVHDTATPPLGTAFYYLVTRFDRGLESIPGKDSTGVSIPSAYLCPYQGGSMSIATPEPPLETGTTTVHRGVITLTYTGFTPLTLSGATQVSREFGDGDFAVVGGTCASGLTLGFGSTCTVEIEYTPAGNINPSSASITIQGTISGGVATTLTSDTFNAD